MMNIFRRLLCMVGIHDFHIVEVTVSFGPAGAVEKVECRVFSPRAVSVMLDGGLSSVCVFAQARSSCGTSQLSHRSGFRHCRESQMMRVSLV